MLITITPDAARVCAVCGGSSDGWTEATDASEACQRCYDCAASTCGAFHGWTCGCRDCSAQRAERHRARADSHLADPHLARLRVGLDSHLADCRWRRDRDELAERHAAARAALDAEVRAGRHNRRTADAARAALAVTHRDEWQRASDYPVRPEVALHSILIAADRVTGKWTRDERNEASARLMFRLVKRHGAGIPAAALAGGYVERALSGIMLNERDRAARALSFDALAEERDEWAADDAEARDAAVQTDVWAVVAPEPAAPVDPHLRGGTLAAALALDEPRMRHRDALTALAAAANGYGSGPALAAATGISAGAARLRLMRGRERIAAVYPSPDALADALALAARRVTARDRIALTSVERRAARAIDAGGRQAAGAPRRALTLRTARSTAPMWRHRADRTALALAALGAARIERRAGRFTAALALSTLAARAALPVRVEWDDSARVRPYRAASRLRTGVDADGRPVLRASATVPGASVNAPRVRLLRSSVWSGPPASPVLRGSVGYAVWSAAYDAALRSIMRDEPNRTAHAAAVLAGKAAAAAVR